MKRSNVRKIIEKIFNLKVFAIVVFIAFLSMGYIYSFKLKGTIYEAKTTLLITKNVIEENRNFDEIISTYIEMTKSNLVLTEALKRVGIENYDMNNIVVQRKNESDFIEIAVVDKSSETAKKISNEISNVIFEKNEEQLNLAKIEVIDEAEKNCKPVYSSQATDMIAFAVMGCFVSLVSCQLIKTFDNKVKSRKDIESIEVKELIELPKIDKKIINTIIKLEDKSMFAEAFKIMRTNIQFINFNAKEKVIMVTEANVRKDLKSFIISNLAAGYANTGKKVMLIDCDLRNGKIAQIFNLTQDFGLANYLSNVDLDGLDINENNVGKYIKNTNLKNLDIITAGYIAPNPSELISTNKFKDTLKILEKVYDVILVNAGTEDINTMSTYIKGCILITEHNRMNKSLMTKIRNQFELKEGKLIGVILANVPMYKLKYFNKYSIYFKSEEEDLLSKKNIEAREAKEQKEKEKNEKIEKKKFKEEVKQIEKEKSKEVKAKKKEEKKVLKELNEKSIAIKINNLFKKLSEFFDNVIRKIKTRNKRLVERIENSVEEKETAERTFETHIQKDAIIQNLEKELEAMHEEYNDEYVNEETDEKYLEERSKEYENISEENKNEPEIEEIKEEKKKSKFLNNFKAKFFKLLEKMSMVEKIDEEKIVDTDYKETENETVIEEIEEVKKELSYEEKYMNNYNELYNSEYSYSSTTSFADFERGNASKIDKSEQDLLDQNEKLDLDSKEVVSKKEDINIEEIMKEQAEEEERLLKEEKADFEKFKKEQKEKKKQEKLEKKKLKKLEKESKMKLNEFNYGDKKEFDQEEEYLMENLYPKFK